MEQLRYFVAVARAGSVSRAAADLYMTQPSLSRSIARLENELGCKLFEHQRGRVVLNERGKRFLPHAEAALSEIRSGLEEISSGTWNKGLVVGNLVEGVLSSALPEFAASHRGLSIRQVPVDPNNVESALCAGEIDLVITAFPKDTDALTYFPLGTVEYVMFCSEASPYSEIEELGLEDLKDASFICDSTRMGRRSLDACCKDAGFLPNVICEVEDLSVIRAVMLSSNAVCIMPYPQYRRLQDLNLDEGVVCKQFSKNKASLPMARLGVAYAVARPMGRTAREFCEYLAETLAH